MTECVGALVFIDEMLKLIHKTDEKSESGFIVCEENHGLSIGARCKGPGNHCDVKPPLCPGGGKPVISFHTHSTNPPIVDAVLDENPFVGESAKVALLPSSKDIVADGEIGAEVGCIGGTLNDGTQLVWCFRSFVDGSEKDIMRSKVELLQKRLHEALRKNKAERDVGLIGVLVDYFESVQSPCLELRLPI